MLCNKGHESVVPYITCTLTSAIFTIIQNLTNVVSTLCHIWTQRYLPSSYQTCLMVNFPYGEFILILQEMYKKMAEIITPIVTSDKTACRNKVFIGHVIEGLKARYFVF